MGDGAETRGACCEILPARPGCTRTPGPTCIPLGAEGRGHTGHSIYGHDPQHVRIPWKALKISDAQAAPQTN